MVNCYYYNKSGEKISVTGKQLKELAQQGIVTPETVIETEEGKTAPAIKVKGLTFAETKQPETVQPVEAEIYGFTSPPVEHAPFVAPAAPQARAWTEPPEPQSPFTQPKVLVPVCVGGGMLLMLLVMFAFSMISGSSSSSDDPSMVARKFDAALKSGNKKIQGQLATPETTKLLSLIGEKAEKKSKMDGKIKSCEHTITGDTAVVHIIYANGDDRDFTLIKVDEKWKIHAGPPSLSLPEPPSFPEPPSWE